MSSLSSAVMDWTDQERARDWGESGSSKDSSEVMLVPRISSLRNRYTWPWSVVVGAFVVVNVIEGDKDGARDGGFTTSLPAVGRGVVGGARRVGAAEGDAPISTVGAKV